MHALPPLPVAVPFAVAALLMAFSSRMPQWLRDALTLLAALACLVVSALLLYQTWHQPVIYWFGGWTPRHGVALGIAFVVDPLGATFALLTAVLVVAATIFSWRYFAEVNSLYPALMLCFLGAMSGFCLTGDLFNMFVFFELMSVAAYTLTAYKIEEKQALIGAFNFAVVNSVGAFMVLWGIALLYGRTGALNLAQIGQTLGSAPPDGLLIAAFTLITIGFLTKAALVPLHFWLADAHAVAPTPVCVLFSGVMVELGLYAFARVSISVFAGSFAPYTHQMRIVLVGWGVLTALIGAILCFAQCHIKRMLAFSTISHVGLFMVGFAVLNSRGFAGAMLYLVGHGLVKGTLFLCAGILLNRFDSVDENTLHGKGRKLVVTGLAMSVGALALSGLPPFGTWLGKDSIEEGAKQAGFDWIPLVLVVTSAMTGGAVLRAVGKVFLGWGPKAQDDSQTPHHEEPDTQENYDRAPFVLIAPVIGLLVLALALGLYKELAHEVGRVAARFLDTHAYAASVLAGVPAPPLPPPLPSLPGSELSGLAYAFAGVLGAVVIALLSLFPSAIPAPLRAGFAAAIRPALKGLRDLHSGHVGDYVTWLVLAAAVLGGLCVRALH